MSEPNQLVAFVEEIGMDADEAVNILQEHGKCSDNCVFLSDVAEANWNDCIKFLDGIL